MPHDLPKILHKAHIRSITRLSPDRPVFQLLWNESQPPTKPDEPFILKAESATMPSMQPGMKEGADFNYGLMREVARGVRGRALDGTETRWLYELIDKGVFEQKANDYVKKSLMPSKDMLTWVIMGFKTGLIELNSVVEKKDVTKAMLILQNMKDDENLKRLGSILVVDMFLNNSDRFRIKPGSQGIQNPGNVFFVDKGGSVLKIKGLDPFDTTKNQSILDTQLSNVNNVMDDTEWWSGTLLTDDKAMKRVAKNACDSLNDELLAVLRNGKTDEKAIEQLRIKSSQRDTVVKSMQETRKQVEGFCRARLSGFVGKAKPRAGLLQRMEILGWKTKQ